MGFDIGAGIASPFMESVCPSCGASFRHARNCDLKPLSIEEAAVLGYDDALKRVRQRRSKSKD